jgi:hypothetical protein
MQFRMKVMAALYLSSLKVEPRRNCRRIVTSTSVESRCVVLGNSTVHLYAMFDTLILINLKGTTRE